MLHMNNKLTLEQEFRLAVNYKKNIVFVNNSNARRLLLATLKQMMIRDNIIKFFIQNRNLNN
uniref:Uncharacterized protein ycf18 n=1 Tax=Bangiopsis subsimplex TaxID=139980 RepID=A0A1C9CCT7_9RHOD|nr:phycobilisome degradation protein [Bangiopsis subsimplex]AOM66164.1 phycobilisome degradation protein [Bangiopsis subsimplex]ARO90476.1 phycobilisome degradation protein [Bangiopsis subsimplex]